MRNVAKVNGRGISWVKYILRGIFGLILALYKIVPSVTVILNPLFFIMFLPVGAYAILAWPWTVLKDIPDPFHQGESLYWLTYIFRIDDGIFLPSNNPSKYFLFSVFSINMRNVLYCSLVKIIESFCRASEFSFVPVGTEVLMMKLGRGNLRFSFLMVPRFGELENPEI